MSGGGGPLRVVFLVQGEGRGHLTQAIALREILLERGHQVVGVFVGSADLALPDFFRERIGIEPERFAAPRTVVGRDRRRVSAVRTLATTILRTPAYAGAVRFLRRRLRELRPDLLVNFYEAVGGIAVGGPAGPRVPTACVGHHYLLGHPEAPQPPGSAWDVAPLRVLTPIAARGARVKLALSLQPFADLPERGVRVVPPLLRKQVLEMGGEGGAGGGHLLVYLLHEGFAEEIVRWHASHPDLLVHCFVRRAGAPREEVVRPNLVFHDLSDTRFLELMRGARGVVGTAGFESVAEAMWFGKPVLVVPTGGHVEQRWNARKVEAVGAGIAAGSFELDRFLEYIPTHRPPAGYREWVLEGRRKVGEVLEEVGAGTEGLRGRSEGSGIL